MPSKSTNAIDKGNGINFPKIQRIKVKTLASDTVSVESLSKPIGLIHYFIPKQNNKDS
jgi:hypothetical protein